MMEGLVISGCRDPRWNLALEEWLLERKEKLLYLWCNDPSVIIGRNQDPFAECVPGQLEKDGIFLVRRKSGGGAVYHDPGNLNISILSALDPLAAEENIQFLRRSLERLGIRVQVSGRNDLEVEGRKISGSAFYETGSRFCHHCTMLVNTDLSAMERYLTPPEKKLRSRGISSVRSRVANLRDLVPGLTVEGLLEALTAESGLNAQVLSLEEMKALPGLETLEQRYASADWTFGESPRADLVLEEKFPWGLVRAELQIHTGCIVSAGITTDSLKTAGFRELADRLRGLPLYGDGLTQAVNAFPDPEIRRDLLRLFSPV